MSQTHFDHVAEQYDEVFKPHIWNHYLQKRVRFIKNLKTGKKLLDFGCGTGVLAAELGRQGFTVTGVEYSKGMLEKARERGVNGVLINPDQTILVPSESFDLAYSVAVFHHLETKENVAKAVSEMVRVVRPGGIVLIWDHNPKNPYWKPFMKRLPQDHGDERLVPLEELVENFGRHPIARLSFRRTGWIPEFIPEWGMPFMRMVEQILEHTPIVKSFSAHNVVVAERRKL